MHQISTALFLLSQMMAVSPATAQFMLHRSASVLSQWLNHPATVPVVFRMTVHLLLFSQRNQLDRGCKESVSKSEVINTGLLPALDGYQRRVVFLQPSLLK